MNVGDLSLAYAVLRGFHTALADVKKWAERKQLTPQDERLLRAADVFAEAGKEWVRSKAEAFARKESNVHLQQ